MIKLDTLTRWRPLAAGEVMTIPGKASRRLRLQVNSPGKAVLYLRESPKSMRFLAAPEGRDVVEFIAEGDVEIVTGSDDVQIYTAEFEPTFTALEDPEVFTQIAQRAARNPELEHMMMLQQRNMERRLQALQAEMEARIDHSYQAGRTDAAQSGGKRPEPDGDGSAPAAGAGESRAPAAGGTGGGEPVERPAGDTGSDVSQDAEIH